MIDVKSRIDKRKAEGFSTANITVQGYEERSHVTSELKKMGYEYEMQHLLRPKSEGETYKVTVQLPPDELGVYHKEVIISHIQSLTTIMEETSDSDAKDRLDEQINQFIKDLKLNKEDIG